MGNLTGRVAIVTGASRGIGRATALLLAHNGAHIVATARSEADLESLEAEIRQAGGAATIVAGDVTELATVEAVFVAADAVTGRLDILVNNAGIGILGPLADMSIEDFDRQLDVNVKSIFRFTRAMIPRLEATGGGNIVNIASISGLVGFDGATAYCATKWATVGMSRGLDKELSPKGIKVTAICPAGVDTNWAFGTGIDPAEVADVDRLSPTTIANAVLYAIQQPANARVTEVVVYPMSENGHQ
ncbi:MAG: SDR family oxidoreductase [Propionicimonas sp.]|uniref:SDR family oxidoreductase n=1 Tax=Propionicimonas sp. TaxID=1955623 RepID=UPI002B1F7FB2|nr:SDR family oxidoreductase [Propionicimonas sp.]MEA4944521.1 SDR family oxidoreductase [Propionicimonas sp.]MEA5054857.1 SDR family oxidoreductase [Propionicimonas sp.]MEA5117415.1 SDR family oxidoreductase [Propionicimonas sp.]